MVPQSTVHNTKNIWLILMVVTVPQTVKHVEHLSFNASVVGSMMFNVVCRSHEDHPNNIFRRLQY